jgi:ribokinase
LSVPGRIVVLGSLNVDLVIRVASLPKPGETVLGDRLETFAGGKGANQAVAAARLGGRVSMVGRVGNDRFGEMLLAQLRRDGVDASSVVRDAEQPSGTALILVGSGGQNMIAVAPGANGAVGEGEVERALEHLHSDGLLVMQLEIPAAVVDAAIRKARQQGSRVLLNAAPARSLDWDLMADLDVLVVNETEATAILRESVSDVKAACRAARKANEAGVRLAVVTLGDQGAVFSERGDCQHVPAFSVEMVDATAAGDAFVGALAVGLANDEALDKTVCFANAAGASAASRLGAQASLPTTEDIRLRFGTGLDRLK